MELKKYITFAIDLIIFPIAYFFRFFFSFTKRHGNIWIFGSWGGLTFSDNTKYLFLYAHENQKDVDVFWITRNKEIYKELLELKLPALYLYSLKGILTCIRSGVQFTTHGIYDIAPVLTKGSVHFSLFHASFPLKKMEFDAFENSLIKKIIQLIRKPFVFEKADYSICSSEKTQSVIKSALGLSTEKVFISGYPRSDYIHSKNHLQTDLNKIKNICDLGQYDNFIYFVPTFRNNPNFDIFEHHFNIEELVEFLEETNSIFIFRFHPYEYQKIMRHKNINHHRIIFESHGLDDPYPLLSKSSVLITDFSSIFADYLLLDKPIVFANFDYEGYLNQERQLYWDYEKVTPGAKVKNWPNLIIELKKIIEKKEDLFASKRQNMRKEIYSHTEGLASKRVCQKVMQVIEGAY